MFKKVVFWKVLKRSRCALLKELSTGRLGILIAWDVPRSTASKSMRVERGGREFVLQRPRHRSRWATTTTCFYCWRPLGIRHSRQKAEPSLSLFPILYISNIHDPSLPLSPLVGPLAPLMVRKEPLYYTLYIYCCWRSPLVLPQPSFLSFSPQKSMFSTYIGCPEKIGTDLLPYIVLYVGISLDSLSNCTTYKCVGVQMPFRPCYLWDTRNKYYICSNYDLIYMKFCFEVVCIIHVNSIVALSFMKSELYPLCTTYCCKIQI